MSIAELDRINEKECSCGKIHSFPIDQILIGKGVIAKYVSICKWRIQCAIGTLIAVQCYEKIRKQVPNREKTLAYAEKILKSVGRVSMIINK